jgi:protein disulfide-isomerase
MSKMHAPVALGLLILTWHPAQLDASIPWMNDIRQAQQIAQQQQRPVLLHFYADWCAPCVRLEREVYPRPDIALAISSNYIPVKIDVQRSPDIARHFGVQSFPTDIVLDPAGRVLHRSVTPGDAGKYLQMLNELAGNRNPPSPAGSPHAWNAAPAPQPNPYYTGGENPTPPAQSPMASMPAAAGQAMPGYGGADGMPPGYSSNPTFPPQPSDAPVRQTSMTPTANPHHPWNAGPPPASPPSAPPAAEAPLALDGFCPVSLVTRESWQRGDARWGAIHRGRTYLFASEAFLGQFMADPDRYIPVLSGFDATRFVDYGESVEGKRRHGMWFRGKMYLFAAEDSLERFQRSPEYYAQQSHEIMMRGTRR